jgi:putative endonuclease
MQLKNNHLAIATQAEVFVASVLQKQGWKILARNFRRVGTEVDIIAMKEKTIAFVEVKYRKYSLDSMQDLRQLMTHKKRKALERGAKSFLQQKERKLPNWETLRFDLAMVRFPRGYPAQLRYVAGV